MKDDEIYRRQREFRDLDDLLWNNAVVSRFVSMYVHGEIVSKDECMFQIIRELAKTRDELIQRATDETIMGVNLSTILKANKQQEENTQ